MKHLCKNAVWFALLFLLLLGVGCHKDVPPPTPIPVEQLQAALEKAFSKANADTKELADQVAAAVQAQDYSKAYTGFQNLLGKPGLTKEQISVATRGSLTVNNLLQAAQASGDTKAAETLQSYRLNK